jgi:glycosyltransferase involved in cell wall biosynthesis
LLPNYPGAVYNAPNTLSNAMAAGCPIIANDMGDLGRIIRQNGCGLLLPEVTPAHICQAVKKLQDPIVRQQMGIAGRRAAETFYNWTIAGNELEQVYAKLMDEIELE